ncbi:MAG: hypothetical protein HYR83_03110 [Planctomycetes bacterium]|nr:hypothetical protein [Planctomycetota bacterium]
MLILFAIHVASRAAIAQTTKTPASPEPKKDEAASAILQPSGSIPLPELKGSLGRMAVDLVRNRLFVVAPDDDAVSVVDMGDKKQIRKIPLAKPRGVIHMPGIDLIGISSAGDGKVHVLNGSKLDEARAIDVGKEPSDMLFDPAGQLVYVSYGRPGIAPIDPTNGKREHDIDVVAVPSVMRMDQAGEKFYAVVPRGNHVAVVDRARRMTLTSWVLREARDAYSLALDDANKVAFVGCRTLPTIFAIDMESGLPTASLPIGKDCDDIHYDVATKRVYVTEGEGKVEALQLETPTHFKLLGAAVTAPGAKNSYWIKETRTLYVGIPGHDSNPPEIRAFKAGM